MKLTALALVAAFPASAQQYTVQEDYCSLNGIVVGMIGSMYLNHDLSPNSVYELVGEFYMPQGSNDADIWNTAGNLMTLVDDGETVQAITMTVRDGCMERLR